MQRFKNILIVLDYPIRSEALIERAVTLSQRNQARLTFITVDEERSRDMPTPVAAESGGAVKPSIDIIETLPPDIPAPITSDSADVPVPISDTQEAFSTETGIPPTWESSIVIQEQINKAEELQLEQVIAPIRQLGVQVSSKVLHGTQFVEIIREVLRNGHDLVMIAAEDYRGLKNMLFGSTTMHLMRKCPCPVWVMKPDQPKQISHILAAVDPTPPDEERNALNIKIMDLATSLAHREHCKLLIIHTWTFSLESHVRSGRVGVPNSVLDEWLRGIRDTHKYSLEELLRRYDLKNLQHQVYLLKGEADRLIPKLVKAKEVELIVMGTVARTGFDGLFIGSTAAKVLRQVDCSVLTVKPDGFKTPVNLDA
jgi:universal stress protein E